MAPIGTPARAPAPFEVRLQPERETIHVQPVGELDIATVPELRHEVGQLTAAGFAHLVIDLRELVFIDCAGVQLLLGLAADAQRDGWRLSLIPGPEAVRRLFVLTGAVGALPFTGPTAAR